MLPDLFATPLTALAYATVLTSLGYTAVALWGVAAFARRRPQAGSIERPPITVLKPICGLEPHLYDNLRSFFLQDYPNFQILFGVRDESDPAISVLERLMKEFPERATRLVVDPRVIGSNYKISNLANMLGQAHHDILVIADADCRVGPRYLADLAAAFADPKVGAVTCLYRGMPSGKRLPDRLGAMFVNEWFLPSVLVALSSAPLNYCFGATMAVRGGVLAQIGGIEALASYLADDFMLGRLVVDKGYRVALARHMVEITVAEPSLKALFSHELRWARTIRTVRPYSYAFSFVTDALPLSLLVGVATGLQDIGLGLIGAALVMRLLMHFVARAAFGTQGGVRPWLVPLRDVMTFAVRAASFVGRGVEWRQNRFSVQADGQLIVHH
jgi:ceramide glucosyltransferase